MKQMKDLPYHIGLKVKIYPSNEQKRLIAVNDGAKRAVYNHLVACGNEKYRLSKAAGCIPSYRDRLEYLESCPPGKPATLKMPCPSFTGMTWMIRRPPMPSKTTARHGKTGRNCTGACLSLRKSPANSPTRPMPIITPTTQKLGATATSGSWIATM